MPPDSRNQTTEPIDLANLADAIAAKVVERLREEHDRLLDRRELAKRLTVSERLIGSLVARGQLPQPLLHTGGVARWDWPTVKKFFESRTGKRPRKGRGRYPRRYKAEG